VATSELKIKITAVDHASAALKSLQSGIIRFVGAVASITVAFKAMTFPAQEAARFEREMINVAKTTNFSERQIESLSSSLLEMSKTMSTSAIELANIAAIAGQLGLGSFGVESIRAFSESVAKATVTLGLTAEAAAKLGAQLTSIFNIDPGNVEQIFSMLNALSNTSVASATELGDAMKRIGSIGGVTAQQSGALVAFFKDMGVQTEVLGTSTVKVFSNMSAKAEDFADVAGLSTQKWLELMEQDVVGALTTVTTKLYEMDRAQRDATAKELFGGGRILSTYTKLINSAADGYKRLYGHLDTATNSYNSGTSSLEEYDKVMNSLTEQSKVMKNSMKALAIEMGDNLTPVILEAVKSMQAFLASAEGQDFLLQVSEGLKSLLQGLVDAVKWVAELHVNWGNVFQIMKAIGSLLIIKGISGVILGMSKGIVGMVVALNSYYTTALGIFSATATGTTVAAATTTQALTSVTAALNASTTARSANARAVQRANAIIVSSTAVAVENARVTVAALQGKLAAITAVNAARVREAAAQAEVNRRELVGVANSANLVRAREQLALATAATSAAESTLATATSAVSLAQEKAAITQIKLTAARARSVAAQAAQAGTAQTAAAVANLGALGVPLGAAAAKTSLLTQALGLLKVAFRSLLGPLGLILAGLYAFKEEIAEALGFQSVVEVDYEAKVRIDRRKLEKEYKQATNILLETGADVLDGTKLDIEIPIDAAPVVDKVAFADALKKQFKDASAVYEAANTIQEQLENAITNRLANISIEAKVDIAAVAGDDRSKELVAGIKDYQKEIDVASRKLLALQIAGVSDGSNERLEEAKKNLIGLQTIYDNLVQTVTDKMDFDFETGSAEELSLVLDDLRQNLTELGSDINVSDFEALDAMVTQVQAIEEAAKYTEAAVAEMGEAVGGFDLALGTDKVDELVAITNTILDAKDQRAKALKASSEAAAKSLDKLAAKEEEVAALRKKYAEDSKGSIGYTRAQKLAKDAAIIKSLQEDINELSRETASSYKSVADAQVDAFRQQKIIDNATKQMTAARASEANVASKMAVDAIVKMSTAELDALTKSTEDARAREVLAKKKIEDANAVGAAYALANGTDFVAQDTGSDNTAETRSQKLLDQLSEMIVKRAALNNQMQEFDQYTNDAIATANRMDGAFDNINKTQRSMRKSMENYGRSLDEVIRDTAQASKNKKFDLGVDKGLKYELKDIDKEYKKLIERARDAGDTKKVSLLEDQRDVAKDQAKEIARLAKLANERKVAEDDVTRKLNEQKTAQKELADLTRKFQETQDSGGFEGVEGIQKYNEAMLELEDATIAVQDASKGSRESLKDLAGIEDVDPRKVQAYEEALKKMDKAGITLRANQITLGKSLADSTVALNDAERSKLSDVYDGLNKEIGELTKNVPGATALIKKMDTEALASTKGMKALGNSVAEANAKISEMASKGELFSDLYASTDKFNDLWKNLGKTLAGGIPSTNVDVGLVLKDGTVDTLSAQVDNVLNASGATYETSLIVTDVVNSDGSKSFKIDNVAVTPNKEELENTTKAVIEGQTYYFKANTPKTRKDLEEAFKEAFDVKVNITNLPSGVSVTPTNNRDGGYQDVQSNAAGGSIRGAGTATSDSILSWLSNGEYVIRASMVSKFGKGFFDMLNMGMLPAFAGGGLAGAAPSGGGSSVASPSPEDLGSVTLNVGDKAYTLYGERKQAKELVNTLKKMSRG